MRLGQLARRIEKRPDQVVEFLAKKKIVVEENPNTKIEDEYVAIVLAHFAPELLESKEGPMNHVPAVVEVEIIPGAAESSPSIIEVNEESEHKEEELRHEEVVSVAPEETAEVAEAPDEVVNTDTIASDELPAVIKAPKVELKGLKVLGKIDLPQPKKKEEANPEPASETNEEIALPEVAKIDDQRIEVSPSPDNHRAKHTRQKQSSSNRKPNRERKNPIALQREREAREAEEKRLQEIERKKKQRTEYYHKRFQSVPTKKASVISEQVEELKAEQLPDKPKTWWGRLIHWLTTY